MENEAQKAIDSLVAALEATPEGWITGWVFSGPEEFSENTFNDFKIIIGDNWGMQHLCTMGNINTCGVVYFYIKDNKINSIEYRSSSRKRDHFCKRAVKPVKFEDLPEDLQLLLTA